MTDLPPPCAESGCRILEGHCASETESLLDTDVGRHAAATDCGSAGHVVDGDHGLETKRRPLNVNDLQRTKRIGEIEGFFMEVLSACSLNWSLEIADRSRRNRVASPPLTTR